MWTQVQLILVLLTVAASYVTAATSAQVDEPLTDVQARKGGGVIGYHYFTKLLYYAAPWIFAFKVKVVIVAVAITLFIIKWWVPFGAGGYPYSSYSTIPGEWSEYPGKESRALTGFTERVMKGLEAAELTYRAATDDAACSARLACEARRAARSNPIAANMVAALNSSLDDLDVTKRSEDCESFDCHLTFSATPKTQSKRR